jgi:hypothetical protein
MANIGYGPLPQLAADVTLHTGPVGAQHIAQPYQDQQQHQQQHQLFSVYVHTPAGMLLPSGSVLSGCELPVRLNTTQGYLQHVLAEAAALLLAAALTDPLNTKFVLLSDTSIPIYTPQVSTAQAHSSIALGALQVTVNVQTVFGTCCSSVWCCLITQF